jgi:superoxide dismutase, Fe-Mn family
MRPQTPEARKRQMIETIMKQIRAWPVAVRNNAGGHYNHPLFGEIMPPNGGGTPDGALGAAITKALGSSEEFQNRFNQAALSVFGSGWAWLSVAPDGPLCVSATVAGASCPGTQRP